MSKVSQPSITPAQPDPEKIFCFAVAFENAAYTLILQIVNRLVPGNAGVAYVTNSALAVELFLKCLIVTATGKSPWGHDLVAIYDQVPSSFQSKIETHYKEIVGHAEANRQAPNPVKFADPHDIRAVLQQGKNAFPEWRYAYELQQGELVAGGLDLIAGAVRRTILEIHPTWERHADSYQTKPPA